MTLAKNKKGFRSIVITDVEYHWHVTDNKNHIDIRIPTNRLTKLIIHPLWSDPTVPIGERNCDNNLVVTPKLISEAILFALNHNWNPPDAKNNLILTYDWKQFAIKTETK